MKQFWSWPWWTNLDGFVVRFDKHLRQYWHPGQGKLRMDSFNILQPGGDSNGGNGCDGYGDDSYSEYGEDWAGSKQTTDQ